MHRQVVEWLDYAVSKYVLNRPEFSVLEIGSLNVNGQSRDHFPSVGLYQGVDIVDGPGVDILANGHNLPMQDNEFDIVVSCNAIEHDDDDEATMREVARVLRPGGHFLLCAPARGCAWHHPPDYRRYNEVDFEYLFNLAECNLLDVSSDDSPGVRGYGVRR